MTRKRKPTVREGELHIYYGKLDKYNAPDVIYQNGPGTHKGDAMLLHSVIGCDSQHLNLDASLGSPRINWVTYEPSLLKELDKRGYDLTTFRLYIRKKQ